MRDDQTRVLVSDWKKINKYVPAEAGSDGMFTPKFGYVTDYLRNNYGIYVWAEPVTNSDLDREDDPYPQRVYKFKSESVYVKKADVYRHDVFTDISYYQAIRKAINKAIEYLEEDV